TAIGATVSSSHGQGPSTSFQAGASGAAIGAVRAAADAGGAVNYRYVPRHAIRWTASELKNPLQQVWIESARRIEHRGGRSVELRPAQARKLGTEMTAFVEDLLRDIAHSVGTDGMSDMTTAAEKTSSLF